MEEFHQLYALADVPFYPTRSDNFLLVVLEAMINETSVIATDADTVRRTVGPSETMVDDPTELFDTLEGILIDGDAERLGVAAREHVECEFTWETIAEKHISIYESLLDGRADAPGETRRLQPRNES